MNDDDDSSRAPRRFEGLDLTGATFREVYFKDVVMRGVELDGVTIDGDIAGLVVNGVDVVPLVEAELDRRDPVRPQMRPEDPDGFRAAWTLISGLWDETVERARTLPPELLHESVEGEWSFVQTLRHLAFATDSWVSRAIEGDPSPWHPLGLPWDTMPAYDAIPWDRDARPSLEEALRLRQSRRERVTALLETLTEERLAADTEPVEAGSWPPPQSFPVRQCLRIVLNEEYHHRLYAERDLDALAMRHSSS